MHLSFQYHALDEEGREKTGRIRAASRTEAEARISARGWVARRLQADSAVPGSHSNSKEKRNRKLWDLLNLGAPDSQRIILFTRQLGTMVQAGIPLLRSLEVLIREEKNHSLRVALVDLAEEIRGGSNLSDAMRGHTRIFNDLYRSMTRAGEIAGALDTALLRLAHFQEKKQKTIRKLRAAMIYPLIVAAVSVFIVGLLMVFVIPRFQSIYRDVLQGAELPMLTQLTIDSSAFLKSYWWALLIALFLVIFCYRKLHRTVKGGRLIDRFWVGLPIVGESVRKLAVARFSQTFATLLESGVPLLSGLLITRDVVRNRVLMDALNHVHVQVRDGETVARALEQTGFFPPMVTSMVQVGEETGQLARMFSRIGDAYEEEVDNLIVDVTSTIEPIMIVFMAIVVGTIVISLFLPMIYIIENLSI